VGAHSLDPQGQRIRDLAHSFAASDHADDLVLSVRKPFVQRLFRIRLEIGKQFSAMDELKYFSPLETLRIASISSSEALAFAI